MKNVNDSIFGLPRSVVVFCTCLLVLAVVFHILPAEGQIYIAQVSQGTGDGSSATNAQSLAWLNNAANWNNGAGTVQPGTTVYLVGTFTNELTVGGSGVAGNPITIYFEPNANFTATSWPEQWWGGGAITIKAENYIVIDGGANGVIQCTNNGSAMTYQINSCGVGAAACSYLTVKNLTIKNLYVRTSNTDEQGSSGAGFGAGISDTCTTGPYLITGFTVTNCTLSDMYVGINSDYSAGCSNYFFIGNKISRVNWGGRCGDRDATSTMTNLVVANNYISSFTNWNDTVGNWYHHNGFYGWAQSGGTLNGVQAYGNHIGPDYGGAYCTSGVFFNGNVYYVLIYDNVFLANAGDAPADGMITASGSFFNNTFIGGGVGSAISAGWPGFSVTIMNNICVNCTFLLANYSFSSLVMNSNLVYNLPGSEQYSFGTGGTSWFRTLANVQAMGYDLNSLNVNPMINPDGTLQAGSPAVGAGANLSNIFKTDCAGSPRPALGNWTIGAYEGAVVGAQPILTPPNNLKVTL